VSAVAAFAAWRARTLTTSGAAAAWTIGVPILHGTGWQGGAILAAFFVSSNVISRIPGLQPAAGIDLKSDRRDHWQVYANGAMAGIGGAIGLGNAPLGLWLVTTTLAAAAADTWATAAGSASRRPPRLIWSARVVPAGSSGGVTAMGTAGAAVGGLIVAGAGALAADMPILLPVGTLIGFLGMAADSALGGLLQGRFRCTACNVASEWRVHRCGAATTLESGMAWLNNDWVNFLSTASAAAAGLLVWYWLSPNA
jgi:uncharacterized protein (TIGR00297 family)